MVVAVVAVISVPTMPIVRPVVRVAVIWSVIIPVWIVVTVRVISVVAWKSEPNTEVNLSFRTRRSCEYKTPGHECD